MGYNQNIMKYTERDKCDIEYDDYKKYKPMLRKLFNYSCCYCTICEGENKLGFFHVEHFKPRSKFPKLERNYENLLYACHKCNIYKKDNWISEKLGCIRDCNNCKNKICEDKDIFRFINPCKEDPQKYIEENGFFLKEKNNSKIGKYTIELLRLNRNQLLKLRQARRNLYMWFVEKCEKQKKAETRLNSVNNQLDRLNRILAKSDLSENERLALEGLSYALRKEVAIYEAEIIRISEDINRISEIVYDRTKRID